MKTRALFLLFVSTIFMMSCERNTETEGPKLSDIYGDFNVLEDFAASTSTVDFSKGENVVFTARFNRPTEWEIRISHPSGSEKVLSGRSREIDATTGVWDGTTTVFPSFSNGQCTAELFIAADSSRSSLNVEITGTRQPDGTVVADFDNGVDPEWNMFVQSGANMSFVTRDTGIIPQGSAYFDMGGEVNWDWLIGLIDFEADSYGPDGFGLGQNPENLYFNLVVNRPVDYNNGIILFQFKEDENGDGTFTEASEDLYAVEIRDLDPGWRVWSIKYSDLVNLVNGTPAEPNGNKQHNPDKIHTISCLFLANPSSGYSQVFVDYVAFTKGEPLKL